MTTTFPRYNSVRKLLETRRGRCGEYANLFGLFCRAAGFETRYVLDVTDHVWVEAYSVVDDRWIMADSCEGLIDKDSMYEHGWGKKLSYNIGVSIDNVTDVTPRYTRKFANDDGEFQARRRQTTSSEAVSEQIIQQFRQRMKSGLPKSRQDELDRRNKQEAELLGRYKNTPEWTEREQHGRGRISGSLEWKTSRREAGRSQKENGGSKNEETDVVSLVQSFHVEQFYPGNKKVAVTVSAKDGIFVSGAKCDFGNGSSIISMLIIDNDDQYLGCVLQCRSFAAWADVPGFLETVPSGRIVALKKGSTAGAAPAPELKRLGGFTADAVLYIGQVDATPDWVVCEKEGAATVEFFTSNKSKACKLRTEKDCAPARVVGRLPEKTMPLQTQLMASEAGKRSAFLSFCKSNPDHKYIGYTTKPNSPVYLLDASSFPFRLTIDNGTSSWNTFHFLPEPLVPEDDNGIIEKQSGKNVAVPKFDIPVDTSFFTQLLGSNLVVNNRRDGSVMKTEDALTNTRLVGLYFSAHWCGPVSYMLLRCSAATRSFLW